MFGAFERMIAARYLRARGRESFVKVIALFSLIGIALGVATLIIVMSVMNGFRYELVQKIVGLNGHLNIFPYDDDPSFLDGIEQDVRATVPGLTSLYVTLEGQALLSTSGAARGVVVRGMDPADLRDEVLAGERLVAGSLDGFFAGPDAERSPRVVAMGVDMARRLFREPENAVGQRVRLVSPQAQRTPLGPMTIQMSAEIVAVFEVDLFQYDNGFLFMPIETARTDLALNRGALVLQASMEEPEAVDDAAQELQERLEGLAGVVTWRAQNGQLANALVTEQAVMAIILSLIILVAAFNIITGLTMLVKDKTRNIAVMRTMGASRRSILGVFLITGSSLGILGTLIGVALGLLIALNIDAIKSFLENISGATLFDETVFFLSQLPSRIDWTETALVVVFAIILSILAALFPALRASRLNPVEALRYE